MKKNLLLIFIALILTTSLLGCDTMKGVGKDIENAGESIQKTAEKND